MKILVTGSSGVAGSALKRINKEYSEHNFLFPTSRDLDLLDWDQVSSFMERERPEGILHFAAVSGGIGLSIKHPAGMLRDNVRMTFNVLEAARLYGVTKTVMTMSTGMYPADAPLPLNEEWIHRGAPHWSNYGSSYAKRLIDPAVRAYREEYGLNVIGLVPNGIFGEDDNFNQEDAPMLPALIRRCWDNRHNADPIVVWGDGTPLREYTYAQDVARTFMWAFHNYDDAAPLNIGSNEEHSIGEIALMVVDMLGLDKNRLTFDTSKPNGIHRKGIDNTRFLALSGYKYTPFRIGLERTVRWFCETYETNPGAIRLHGKMHNGGAA